MLRVQAFIRSHENGVYEVEAHAEGVDTPFIFSIPAKSDKDAAMEAIRRVEGFDSLVTQNMRTN
jgi:hypothetical protein